MILMVAKFRVLLLIVELNTHLLLVVSRERHWEFKFQVQTFILFLKLIQYIQLLDIHSTRLLLINNGIINAVPIRTLGQIAMLLTYHKIHLKKMS
jgi:hypothetical protein